MTDIISIILIFVGLIIGYIIAKRMLSKQKWGDKEEVLNERWKRNIAEIEKKYDVKIKEYDTKLEKMKRDWEIRYVKDLQELENTFKNAEKIIKLKSVSSSRRTLIGKFIEKFVPFLSKIPFTPSDMHFLGQPIDYIVFDGLHEDDVKKIVFLEVKTGKSKLNKREKSLKEAVERKKVYWMEKRIDTDESEIADEEIKDDETAIKEIYENISNKIKNVKNLLIATKSDRNGERGEYIVECPHCKEEIAIELDIKEIHELKLGDQKKIRCTECKKPMIIDSSILEN